MADPKIKYDIEAAVSGSADVIALANHVEKLGDSLEGDLKANALAAADSLRELGRQDAVLSQFANLRNSVQQTATQLTAAQKASAALGFEISASAKPTAAQAGQLQKLRDTAKSLEVQLGLESVALQRLDGSLRASGISTSNFVTEQVRVKNALAGATVEANKVVGVNKEVAKSYDGVASSLGTLKSQVAGLVGVNIGANMVTDVLATADAFNNLQARIKISTGEGAAFTQSFKEVSEIALRTGANLEQTGILFTKLVESGKSGGLTLEAAIGQSLRLTEIISQASLIGSSSAESSRAAINQLNQSLASGVLRGDEFNSVMEQAPRISKAMADGLGVTVGQLRSMAEAGALTSDVVIKALKNQADVIQKEFATLPLTVGRSVEKLQTQWTLYIGDLDKGNGITAKVAKGLDLLANNLNGVINTVTAGVAVYAGYSAVQKLAGDSAAVAAAKVEAQALASGKAALATDAHGKAALVAAVEVKAYGDSASITGAQVAGASKNAFTGVAAGAKSAVGAIGSVIGKVAAYGAAVFAVYEIGKLAVSGVDQLLRKYSGLNAAEEKLAAANKAYADAMKARVIEQEKENLLKQVAIDKTFGLTEASRKLITEFDEVVKKGGSAADAIGKIGKDFDLSTVPGIQGARAVLDKLLSDGKITAQQFKQAFDGALTGIDLTAFNKNAKKVLDETVAEARAAAKQLEYAIAQGFDKKTIAEFEVAATAALVLADKAAGVLQKNLDAGLRETVKRAGLDFELLSTGMSKAAKSAIDDTNVMIKGLTALKTQGVDTAQALTASLGKSINTADSVKALEVVKSQIEAVRKALGDKVADGLLDQAKTKATELTDAFEKAKPGIQSLREALKQLNITSDKDFKDIAVNSKAAFEAMKLTGLASARELSEAFKKVATDAIAANNGVAPEWVKAEAAVRGVTIAVDANGKATVESAAKSKQAINEVASAWDATAAAASRAALAAANAKYSRPGEDAAGDKKAIQDRNDKLAGQNYVDNSFQFAARDALERGTLDQLDPKVLAELVQTLKLNERRDADLRRNNPGYADPEGYRDIQEWKVTRSRLEVYLAGLRTNTTTQTNPAITNQSQNTGNTGAGAASVGSAKVINIQIGGGNYPVQTNAQGADNLIKALQLGARNAGR